MIWIILLLAVGLLILFFALVGRPRRLLKSRKERLVAGLLSVLLVYSAAIFSRNFVNLSKAATRPELVTQTGHDGWISSASFSRDGKILASTGGTKLILWDVDSGRELRRFTQIDLSAAVFSPTEDILASDENNVLILRDVATGKILHNIVVSQDNISTLAFSPDGTTVACGIANREKSYVITVNIRDQTTTPFYGPSDGMFAVAFSPNSRLLAMGGYKNVFVWDRSTGARLYDLSVEDATVDAMAFSPDGRTIAASSSPGVIRFWDLSNGKEIRTTEHVLDNIHRIAYSPDGKYMAVAEGSDFSPAKKKVITSIKLMNAETLEEVKTLKAHAAGINDAAFSRDSKFMATCGDDSIINVWDVQSGTEIRTLTSHYSYINFVVFSPNGKTLAAAGGGGGKDPGVIRLWDLASGKETRILQGHLAIVVTLLFSPDSTQLVSGSTDGAIKLWDVNTGTELGLSTPPDGMEVQSFHFDSSAKLIAALSKKMGITVKDVTSNQILRVLTPSEGLTREIQVFRNMKPFPGGGISSAAFSPDGKTLASGASPGLGTIDRAIKLWDLETGQEQTLPGRYSEISAMAFSPDGSVLATGSGGMGYNVTRRNETLTLWDVKTGQEIRTIIGNATGSNPLAFRASDDINALAFSPDGQILASVTGSRFSSGLNAITLWEAKTGREIRTLAEPPNAFTTVAFSPNGKLLATGGKGEIKLWEVESGKELISLIPFNDRDWLAIAPNGLFDGSPATWNQIQWRFSENLMDVAPVEIYFKEFFYPGLLTEVFSGKQPQAEQSISALDRRQPKLQLSLIEGETAPAGGITSRHVKVRIQVNEAQTDNEKNLSPGGVRDVRLFRNDLLVHVWRGDVPLSAHQAQWEITVPIVAGENRLTAYAFNHDNVKSSDTILTFTGASSLERKGTLFIMAVGVTHYANSNFDLRYAVADSLDFAEELKQQQQRIGQFENIAVNTIADAQATKANILQTLDSLAKQSQPEDAVIVFFAGHGTAQGNRFYLVPYDLGYDGSREQAKEQLPTILEHSISGDELEQAFEKIDCRYLLFVIDACNSGQALESDEKRRGPMNTRGLAQLAYEKGMYILAAAQSYQAAFETEELQHGYLTYSLIEEGLKANASDHDPQDRQTLLREWLNYATERVPQMQIYKLRGGRILNQDAPLATDEQQSTLEDINVQRPRIFYRRESESQMLVISRQ